MLLTTALSGTSAALARDTVVAVMLVWKEGQGNRVSEPLQQQIVDQISALPGYKAKLGHHGPCDDPEVGAQRVGATLYVESTVLRGDRVLSMALYKIGKKDPLRTSNVPLVKRRLPASSLVALMDRRKWIALTTPSVTC